MIKNFITFVEMKNFIDDVMTLCVTDGKYQPFMKEFAVNYCILKYYTDYDTNKGFEEIYVDMYFSAKDTIDNVYENSRQLNDIVRTIEEAISIQTAIETNRNRLGEFVDSMFDSLDNPETMDKFIEMVKNNENTENVIADN